MQALKTLIDNSLKSCGNNQSELARRLGVSTSLMNAIIKGQRSLTWPHAAMMAEMTGADTEEAIKAALIAETPMLKNGAKLREILGKGLAAGGLATLAFSSNAAQITDMNSISSLKKDSHEATNIYIVYIRKLLAWAQRRLRANSLVFQA